MSSIKCAGVHYLAPSHVAPYFEMCNMFTLLDTFTQKIHNYFKVPYHLTSRKHVILIIY